MIMARKGITYDEVAAVADRLVSQGELPTIQRVRDVLGTGSPNTIHKHLAAWKETQPQAQREAVTLPEGLADALIREIERQASAARAESEDKALEARRSADSLAEVGEALEEENEELKSNAEILERERDQAQALAGDRQHEIDRLVAVCDRELKAAEAARVDLARAQLTIESYGERLAEQKMEIQRLSEKVDSERDQRQQSEQRAAVSESKVSDLTTQIETVRTNLDSIKSELKESERERSKLTVFESKFSDLKTQFSELDAKRSEAEDERFKALSSNERNSAKLESAHDRIKQLETQLEACQKQKAKAQ
jgi:colicin import membrane protein